MKILMTGGSGFVGRNVKEYLLQKGYEVYAPTSRELNGTDEETVADCLKRNRYDVVLNFAVHVDEEDLARGGSKMLDYNLRMFLNFYRHSDLYDRMIYAGSGAEYDKRFPISSVTEEDIGKHLIPTDHYGLMKYTVNQIIEKSENIYNLRLFGIFGKYEEWKTKYISNLCCKSLKGLPLSLRKNCWFDYLWIDDFCRLVEMFLHLQKPKHHVYNAVSGVRVSLYELAQLVNEVADKPQDIIVCSEGWANEYTANNDRIREELPEWELTDMRAAVEMLYDWYRENIDSIDIYSLIYG